MSLDFKPFKDLIAHQFKRMAKHQLFRTKVERQAVWDAYLAAFPEGTDPIFRTRTEHDCSCCRSFIKTVGNVVAIIDGKLVSIWDIEIDGPYQIVADALSVLVKSQPIDNLFLHTERVAGTDKTFEEVVGQVPQTWQHFYVNLPDQFIVRAGKSIGSELSEPRATHDVMLRSLTEITDDAIATTLELMAAGSLYRGEEKKHLVVGFEKLKREFNKLTTDEQKDLFVWSKVNDKAIPYGVARIRNDAIGTLLVDLSEGKELEDAVRAWEAVMAPTNYKRPTALVSKKQIEQAGEKIKELGLMSALDRRFAVLPDVSVNNVLFANRDSKPKMADNIFEELTSKVPEKPRNFDRLEEIPMEKFIAEILPKVDSVEILLENRLTPNLVSLVAPADPTAGQLFKWSNGFSWDYNGGVTDSIKERVKAAGGNVTGDLCCRLAWYNNDDLDFHMAEPNRYEIQFTNKRQLSPSGGMLDVDMNGGDGMSPTRQPVENIFYRDRSRMREGTYQLIVHNYSRRETIDVGFEVELDYLGTVYRFVYDKAVAQNERVLVVEFQYTHKHGIEIIRSLPSTETSKTVWGLPTQTFHKVNVMMFSPNHWDGQGVGNRHYMFFLEGCQNDGPARGFYNEFLNTALEPHRKAFELVGSKMKTPESKEQLSGLGLSTTQRNHVIARVTGAVTRTLKLTV